MLIAPKKIGLTPTQKLRALPTMSNPFPEQMNGDTLVICLRIREDGLNIVKKGNSAYRLWKMDSFYTKSRMGIKMSFCHPILASVQHYIIQNYSTKDVDILKIIWSDVLHYIHYTLDDGVALNGDEYEPDYEKWGEITAGK